MVYREEKNPLTLALSPRGEGITHHSPINHSPFEFLQKMSFGKRI